MNKSGAFLILFFLCPALLAQPTLEDYGNLPEVQHLSISPDGDRIAYRKANSQEDLAIVYSIRTSEVLTGVNLADVKARNLGFLNNDFIYIQAADNTRIAGFRGKIEMSTAFSVEIKTGELRQLLRPGDGVVYPGQSGVGKIVGISPNGRYVYMPAYSGNPTMVLGDWADPPYSLLRTRIAGSGKPRVVKGGRRHAIDFFVDAEGEPIVREEYDNVSDTHSIHARHEGNWVEIYREETPIMSRSYVGLTHDEKELVFLDEDQSTGRDAYYTMSLKDGSISGPFHSRENADIESVLTSLQRIVYGIEYSGLFPTYLLFDNSLNERIKNIQNQFPDHSVAIEDFSPDWKHIIVKVEGSAAPGDYYLFPNGKTKGIYITSQRSNIKPDDVHPLGTVTFTARDGLKIPTVITIPRASINNMKNLPAVIMPHGGPASYDKIEFDYFAQALAQQGYMVIMPQFRGSSGFGREHQVAGYGEWGKKMQDDLSDAVAFFVSKQMVDPQRVCIVGSSYGGYAALAGGAFSPDLYKCVVSINGISNLKDFRDWKLDERGRSSQSLSWWELQIGGEDYTSDKALAVSPALHVKNYQAPVLLIHGKDDEVVRLSQSTNMYKALKRANKVVELIELTGDDHYLSLGETRLKALKATVNFVNTHLQ